MEGRNPPQTGGLPGKIAAPLNDPFAAVEWGIFTLGQLFAIEKTASFNADRLTPGDAYDYITRTSLNQGILCTSGFVNHDNLNPAGTWSLGLLQMDFFYRERAWYAGQFVRRITPKVSISRRCATFFTALLNKQKPILLSVLVRDVDTAFQNLRVKLPVTEDGAPDFALMERVIAELEARHIAELEAYLEACGLQDTHLSLQEEQALAIFSTTSSRSQPHKTFRLGDLFDIRKGKRLTKDDMLPGTIPFVGSSSQNNGQTATIGNTEHLHSGNTFTVSYNGSVGEVFYQPDTFWASDDVNVFYSRFQMSRSIALFCMTAIRKYGKRYNYAHKWTKERMEAERVSLPVTAEGKPDYAGMATLISAVEKRVIERLRAWRKREREATARCAKDRTFLEG